MIKHVAAPFYKEIERLDQNILQLHHKVSEFLKSLNYNQPGVAQNGWSP